MEWAVSVLILAFLAGHGAAKTLVLAGGGTGDSNQVWDEIIEHSGGSLAKIGVISAASSTPASSGAYYVDLFLAKGAAESHWIPVHEDNLEANSDPEVVDLILQMTGFFFSGGDQARIINSFYLEGRVESPALVAIREVYESGGLISGDSAGTAVQGRPPMIMDGYSWESCVFGAYATGDPDMPEYTVEYDPDGGLGMINDYICDSHFGDRGREGRLARLVADTLDMEIGSPYGIGVDEATSLIITDVDTPQAQGEVIPPSTGYGGVWIVDLSEAEEVTTPGQTCWHMRNINTHYVTQGDVINMGSGSFEINYANYKSSIVGDEEYNSAATSSHIFYGQDGDYTSRAEFPHVACRLVDCRQTEALGSQTLEANPRYEVNFYQEASTEGYGGYPPASNLFTISYRNLKVEIKAASGDENHARCGS